MKIDTSTRFDTHAFLVRIAHKDWVFINFICVQSACFAQIAFLPHIILLPVTGTILPQKKLRIASAFVRCLSLVEVVRYNWQSIDWFVGLIEVNNYRTRTITVPFAFPEAWDTDTTEISAILQ